MRRALVILAVAVTGAWAHDPVTTRLSWSAEISRLALRRCAGCHQAGGPAPFPMTGYAEARPWAVAIKEAVLTRQMPPWPAVKGYGEFVGDLSLTQEEISLLADWVEGGAPEGDRALLPAGRRAASVAAPQRPAGREMTLRPGDRLVAAVTVRALRIEAPGRLAAGVTPLVWGLRADPRWLVLARPVQLAAGTPITGTGRVTAVVVDAEPTRAPGR